MEEIVWLANAAHRLQGHRLRLLEQRRSGPRREGGLVVGPRPPTPQLRRANSSGGGELGPAGRRQGGQGGRRRHRVADRGRCRAWGCGVKSSMKRRRRREERALIPGFRQFKDMCSPVLLSQFFGSGIFIPDPNFSNPGSRIRIFCHPGSRIRIQEFKYFNPTKLLLVCRKYNPGCSSRIRIPDQDFLPIPDPEVQKDTGSRIRIRNTAFLG